jgi:hypothetical protein
MNSRVTLTLALLLIKLALCLPVAALVLFGWRDCADAALSASSVLPVQGQLLSTHTDKRLSTDFKPGRKRVAFSYRFGERDYVGDTATFCAALTTASQIDPCTRCMRSWLYWWARP